MRAHMHAHTYAHVRAHGVYCSSHVRTAGANPRLLAVFNVEMAHFLRSTPSSATTSHKGPEGEGGARAGPGRPSPVSSAPGNRLLRKPHRPGLAAGAEAQVPAEPMTAFLAIGMDSIFSPENGEWIKGLANAEAPPQSPLPSPPRPGRSCLQRGACAASG